MAMTTKPAKAQQSTTTVLALAAGVAALIWLITGRKTSGPVIPDFPRSEAEAIALEYAIANKGTEITDTSITKSRTFQGKPHHISDTAWQVATFDVHWFVGVKETGFFGSFMSAIMIDPERKVVFWWDRSLSELGI